MNTVDHAGIRHRRAERHALVPVGLWLLSLAALAAACGASDDAAEAPSTDGVETTMEGHSDSASPPPGEATSRHGRYSTSVDGSHTRPEPSNSSEAQNRFDVNPETCESPRWALRTEEEALALYATGCLQLEDCVEGAHVSFILDPHSFHCLHPDDPDFDLNPPPPRPPTIEPCEDDEHIQEVREARACLLYHLAELEIGDVELYARSMSLRLPYYPACDDSLAVAVARHPATNRFQVCYDEESEPPGD